MTYQGSNYSGRQPNSTAYIKNFVTGTQTSLWKQITYKDTVNNVNINAITPSSSKYDNVYIPGNLYVDGIILTPSDAYLKDKIEDLSKDVSKNLMNIRPTQFVFNKDPFKNIHYGFIAQEFEEHFPELVISKIDKDIANLKTINYLEMIPLLVNQIQKMQKEIDELKEQINIGTVGSFTKL
jgi:hypothetical protein